MNLLFIGLIAMLISHEQCTKLWSKKKKKKEVKNEQNANVCAFGMMKFVSLFLLLFMDPIALFSTIHKFHCTISTK